MTTPAEIPTASEAAQGDFFGEGAFSLNLDDVQFAVLGANGEVMRTWLERHVRDSGETINDLSEAEKNRLQLVFVPTAHVPQYAAGAISGLWDADYVLFEGLGATEEQRLTGDVITNLAVRGYGIESRPFSLPWVWMSTLQANNDWRSQVTNGICDKRRYSPPIFRTIDMAEDSPNFDPDVHSPSGLSLIEADRDLYSTSLNELRGLVGQKLTVAARHIRDRDEEMFHDISKIAAQAVRETEGSEKIVIGVGLGAVHSLIARKFMQSGVDVIHHWAGPAVLLNDDILGADSAQYSYGLHNAVLRKAAYCPEELDEDDVDCMLSFEYIAGALRSADPRLALGSMVDVDTAHLVDMVASEAVYRMKPDEREAFLKKITSHRANDVVPFFKGVRIEKARRRILGNTLTYLEEAIGPLGRLINDVLTELND